MELIALEFHLFMHYLLCIPTCLAIHAYRHMLIITIDYRLGVCISFDLPCASHDVIVCLSAAYLKVW